MYYIIRKSSDPKIIGVKDGLSQVLIDEQSFLSKDYYKKFSTFFSPQRYLIDPNATNAIPDFNVKVDRAQLLKSAKLNDFIDYHYILPQTPFIISKKIKNIFESLKLKGIYFYPVNIYSNDKAIEDEYFLLYTFQVEYNAIIFHKSILVKDLHFEPYQVINISSVDELNKSKEDYGLSQFKKLTLKKESLFNNDFIVTTMSEIFISELLRDIFIQEKVTGLNIIESDVLSVE